MVTKGMRWTQQGLELTAEGEIPGRDLNGRMPATFSMTIVPRDEYTTWGIRNELEAKFPSLASAIEHVSYQYDKQYAKAEEYEQQLEIQSRLRDERVNAMLAEIETFMNGASNE